MKRNISCCLGTFLALALSTPLYAQVGVPLPDQQQQYPSTQQPGQPSRSDLPESGAVIPSLQDIRSPLTTIVNRPAAAGGAAAPGARLTTGTDLPLRIREF